MNPALPEFPRSKCLLACSIVGVVLTLLYFLAAWNLDINMADEGFYWYGAQRTLHGEVPFLDFMAYDPGRYYIGALVMQVVGSDGIWAARLASYLVLGLLVSLGIYLALLSFQGTRKAQILYSAVVALILIIWAYPTFRTFDFLAGVLLILAVSIFLRHRSLRGWFFAGLILGLVAILGRNHGVYGVFGHLVALAIIYLDRESVKPTVPTYFAWVLGVFVGYLPIILLAVFVDGFAQAFYESIKFILESSATNIPLPVPWPWPVDIGKNGLVWSAVLMMKGLFFVGLLAFPIIGLGYVALARKSGWSLMSGEAGNSVFLASICLALPYAQYAFSRADIEHLAPSLLPLIFGMLSIPIARKSKARILVGVLLVFSGAIVMLGTQPALRYFVLREQLEVYAMGPDEMLIPADQAEILRGFDLLIVEEKLKGGSFLALPNFPTVHAIHSSKMQIWEIYSLFNRPKLFEEKEIVRMEKNKPSLVILSNHALDKNEALRYSNMHPVTYRWLNTHYRKESLENNIEIYRRK